MAANFLKSYGVDLEAILDQANPDSPSDTNNTTPSDPVPGLFPPSNIAILHSVQLARSSTALFDVSLDLEHGTIKAITAAKTPAPRNLPFCPDVAQCLALPSLCHPHVHLDKPYLLSHPDTQHLVPESGSFAEALRLTAEAKKLYTPAALVERGNWLVADSVRAGVTHMRAFVEVDATVQQMCVDAGLELKRAWARRCEVQICAFAQDPVFSGEHAERNRALMREAVRRDGVDVIGSTPYVEEDVGRARSNIEWAVALAIEHGKHLDFHLDYNLDAGKEAQVWDVIEALKNMSFVQRNPGKTVCLGHCTRLALFSKAEWKYLSETIKAAGLPVSFVGLPTSDSFMQGRPGDDQEFQDKPRATLQVPWLIKKFGLDAALSLNNVGNAFTPQGSADPLGVASLGVGLYQVGTAEQAHCLYVSHLLVIRGASADGLGLRFNSSAKCHRPCVFKRPRSV